MAKAGTADLYIEQGATFSQDVTLKNSDNTAFDLTGATFEGQIRPTPESPEKLAEFTAVIVGDPTLGVANLSLSADLTKKLPVKPSGGAVKKTSKLAYDLYMTQGSVVTRLLEGTIEVSPSVSR